MSIVRNSSTVAGLFDAGRVNHPIVDRAWGLPAAQVVQ